MFCVTVKEENCAGLMLCVLRLNTPPIPVVLILIVRLIHCYDVLILNIVLGTGTTTYLSHHLYQTILYFHIRLTTYLNMCSLAISVKCCLPSFRLR